MRDSFTRLLGYLFLKGVTKGRFNMPKISSKDKLSEGPTWGETILSSATEVHPRWYNRPLSQASAPDWKKWRNLAEMQLWQAVALSCGLEPDKTAASWPDDEYQRRLAIAISYLAKPGPLAAITPAEPKHLSPAALADVAGLGAFCVPPWTLPDEFSRAERFSQLVAEQQSGLVPQPMPSVRAVQHSTKSSRRDALTPVIERAQGLCDKKWDTAEVWARMISLAVDEHPPLLGVVDEKIKWSNGGQPKYFSRDDLGGRLRRAKRR